MNAVVMPWEALAGLAVGTYAFRALGSLLGRRVRLPDWLQDEFSRAATVLLLALAVGATLVEGHAFAGWARTCGVLVAGVLIWRRAPFPIVVVAAALVTALLRVVGLP